MEILLNKFSKEKMIKTVQRMRSPGHHWALLRGPPGGGRLRGLVALGRNCLLCFLGRLATEHPLDAMLGSAGCSGRCSAS